MLISLDQARVASAGADRRGRQDGELLRRLKHWNPTRKVLETWMMETALTWINAFVRSVTIRPNLFLNISAWSQAQVNNLNILMQEKQTGSFIELFREIGRSVQRNNNTDMLASLNTHRLQHVERVHLSCKDSKYGREALVRWAKVQMSEAKRGRFCRISSRRVTEASETETKPDVYLMKAIYRQQMYF